MTHHYKDFLLSFTFCFLFGVGFLVGGFFFLFLFYFWSDFGGYFRWGLAVWSRLMHNSPCSSVDLKFEILLLPPLFNFSEHEPCTAWWRTVTCISCLCFSIPLLGHSVTFFLAIWDRASCGPGQLQTQYAVMDDLIPPVPCLFLLGTGFVGLHHNVYAMQEIKPCTLFKTGMNSTNWAISPALFWIILLYSIVSLRFIK